MSTGDDGFYFDFDGELQAAEENLPSRRGRSFSPSPTVLTSCFPWVSLSSQEMSQWNAKYPTSSSLSTSGSRAASTTRHLTLSVPSDLTSSRVYHLCYQSPPKSELVTLSNTPEECSTEQRCPGTSSELNQRDIIPGQYYGGLKVWSCAPFLARYLFDHEKEYRQVFSFKLSAACGNMGTTKNSKQLKKKSVLVAEVGCGHALPGLAALCLGASRLLLQDYNKEVLETCTGPNVCATFLANKDVVDPSAQVKLVHGDWTNLGLDEEEDGNFCDVILGSDVTFDKEACEKLVCLLHRWMTPKTGFALIGSKEYYFGTNGGRIELTESARCYGLKVETLEYFKDGSSMERTILKITQSPSARCQ